MHTPIAQTEAQSAQARFDEKYISAAEIAASLKVSRSTVSNARVRGLLPDPIVLNEGQIYIYERATVTPYLDAWRKILDVRRDKAE